MNTSIAPKVQSRGETRKCLQISHLRSSHRATAGPLGVSEKELLRRVDLRELNASAAWYSTCRPLSMRLLGIAGNNATRFRVAMPRYGNPEPAKGGMKKLRVEELQVDSFTAGETPNELRGTVRANESGLPCDLTYNGCPTQYCVTYPLNTCGGA